jgi:hypothetical protein
MHPDVDFGSNSQGAYQSGRIKPPVESIDLMAGKLPPVWAVLLNEHYSVNAGFLREKVVSPESHMRG